VPMRANAEQFVHDRRARIDDAAIEPRHCVVVTCIRRRSRIDDACIRSARVFDETCIDSTCINDDARI